MEKTTYVNFKHFKLSNDKHNWSMIQTHPSPCYPVCYISQKNKIQRLKGVFYIVVLLLNERNILEGVQIIIIIES